MGEEKKSLKGGRQLKKKQAYYLGKLVRLYCPGLYSKPVYDKEGRFIPYKIIIPKIGNIGEKEDKDV